MAPKNKQAAGKNAEPAAEKTADVAATEQAAAAIGGTDAAATSEPVGESVVQTDGSAVTAEDPPPNNPTPSEELAAGGEHDAQQSTAAELQSGGGDEVEGYWVRAVSPQGRRRAGFSISHEGIGFGAGVLTDEQLDALRSDPQVVVQECVFGNSGPV